MESQGHDQYLVKIDGSGRLTLRNRRFLRQCTAASPVIRSPNASPPLLPSKVVERRRAEQPTPEDHTGGMSVVPPVDTAQVPQDLPAVPVDPAPDTYPEPLQRVEGFSVGPAPQNWTPQPNSNQGL